MEEMIAKWIRETQREYEKAKLNQNAFKMIQMSKLEPDNFNTVLAKL